MLSQVILNPGTGVNLDSLLASDSPLFTLAVLLVSGAIFGLLAKKVRLPSVTGQIVVGILLGPAVFHVFSHEAVSNLQPVVHFALGLIAVDVGTHIHFRKLRNSFRRLGMLLLLEITLTPLLVYVGLVFCAGQDWTFGFLFGALAISTAPATVLALVKETRSKGVYVRTLIAAVALNNIACIAIFETARAVVSETLVPSGDLSLGNLLLTPLLQLTGAAVLGAAVGVGLLLATRLAKLTDHLTTVSIIAILLATGVADFFGVSNMLACLFLGITIANIVPEEKEIGHRVFADFEPAVLAIFFTLAGMELDFDYLSQGWVLVALFVVARICGKVFGGILAMRMANTTTNVRRYLGLGLIPQAGIAVGLLLQIGDDPVFASMRTIVLAVGVTAVAVNEIVGPITTRIGLARSGNLGKDRNRLIDFIHEENITIDFSADSKEEAIEQLVDLLITSHGLQLDRDEFLADVLNRERQMSTCVGRGLAVPSGQLPGEDQIAGVMGVSQAGLDLCAPDGLPVHCMVLLASTPELNDRYLQVQTVLARSLGLNWGLQAKLYNSKSPAHVYETLHDDEFEDINYFLDEGEDMSLV